MARPLHHVLREVIATIRRHGDCQIERGRIISGLSSFVVGLDPYEQPLVEPQVSHFRQVPLRTIVKLPHSEQLSPS